MVYSAVSLGRVFPWFADPLNRSQSAWLLERPPVAVAIAPAPVKDFVINRSNKDETVQENDEGVAMEGILRYAQSLVFQVIGPREIAAPTFVSTNSAHHPKRSPVMVRMSARKLIDLPDVSVGLKASRAIWQFMNRRQGRNNSDDTNAPKLRRVKLAEDAAESRIPCGLFLPIEIGDELNVVPGAIQLLTRVDDQSFSCMLHLLDGAVPRTGTRLRRRVIGKVEGKFVVTEAEIGVIVGMEEN